MGKTTTAVNVAADLAIAGKRCVLVDIDPQGNATSGLGSEKRARGGSDAALTAPSKPEAWIETSRIDRLALVPAADRLSSAEQLLRHEVDRYRQLKRALEHMEDRFEFVLIDCPPSSGLLTLNAIVAADHVIIPVQCEYYAMEGLAQMIHTLDLAEAEQEGPGAERHFLFTMYDPAEPLAGDIINEVLSHFESRTFRTWIPRDPALSEAPSHGVPVIEYAPNSRGANAYVQLAREIMDATE